MAIAFISIPFWATQTFVPTIIRCCVMRPSLLCRLYCAVNDIPVENDGVAKDVLWQPYPFYYSDFRAYNLYSTVPGASSSQMSSICW